MRRHHVLAALALGVLTIAVLCPASESLLQDSWTQK